MIDNERDVCHDRVHTTPSALECRYSSKASGRQIAASDVRGLQTSEDAGPQATIRQFWRSVASETLATGKQCEWTRVGIRAGLSEFPTQVRPRFLVLGHVRIEKFLLLSDSDRVRCLACQLSVGPV